MKNSAAVPSGAAEKRRFKEFIRGSDRKSTRLNSSHITISYAVFCLKKKKNRLLSAKKLQSRGSQPIDRTFAADELVGRLRNLRTSLKAVFRDQHMSTCFSYTYPY